jgi:hypothetical protein
MMNISENSFGRSGTVGRAPGQFYLLLPLAGGFGPTGRTGKKAGLDRLILTLGFLDFALSTTTTLGHCCPPDGSEGVNQTSLVVRNLSMINIACRRIKKCRLGNHSGRGDMISDGKVVAKARMRDVRSRVPRSHDRAQKRPRPLGRGKSWRGSLAPGVGRPRKRHPR